MKEEKKEIYFSETLKQIISDKSDVVVGHEKVLMNQDMMGSRMKKRNRLKI